MKILAGDIGGTKTLLQLVEASATPLSYEVLYEHRFASSDFDGLTPLVERFLADAEGHVNQVSVDSACFAVAGPVQKYGHGQAANVTNLPWQLSTDALASSLSVPRIGLINDFEAVGYGIDALSTSDLEILQTGNLQHRGARAVLGAGTGLGICQMIWLNSQYTVIPSEGGHCDFAPTNEVQLEFLNYMQSRYAHVSYDRVLSGRGITSIFSFLAEREDMGDTPVVQELLACNDTAAAITAAQGELPLAKQVIQLFVEIYGGQAGNLALLNLARGGVFIAGGIAPKLIDELKSPDFLRAFTNKGRMTALMNEFPVSVITNSRVGVIGAVVAGIRLAVKNGHCI